MRLLGNIRRNEQILLISIANDQQRVVTIGYVWPLSSLSDNQVSISRSLLDQFPDQQLVELQTIAADNTHPTNSISLRSISSRSMCVPTTHAFIRSFIAEQPLPVNLVVAMNVV